MSETPFRPRHEEDVGGLAATIFADIRQRLAFTPAIFKALADDPPVLERAWLQARSILDDPGFAETTGRLRDVARVAPPAAPSDALADAVAPFAAELPGMLLVVSSLGLTLDGRLPLRPPPPLDLPERRRPPEPTVPEARGEHPQYAAIRSTYGTEHVPSLYRSLAATGLLDEGWAIAAPLLGGADGAARIAAVTAAGEHEALGFPDAACFDIERARPLLDQFRVALPRNLIVALALSRQETRPRRREAPSA